MDFTFRDTDLAIQAAIARFAERELAPRAAALDEEGSFATRHLPMQAAAGVMGLNLPERWGGAGVSPIALFLAAADPWRLRIQPRLSARALCA